MGASSRKGHLTVPDTRSDVCCTCLLYIFAVHVCGCARKKVRVEKSQSRASMHVLWRGKGGDRQGDRAAGSHRHAPAFCMCVLCVCLLVCARERERREGANVCAVRHLYGSALVLSDVLYAYVFVCVRETE